MRDKNPGRSVKPNLFIVGAPKCGTSAWVHYLGSHPDICFSTIKEPHYFCFDHKNWRFIHTLDEYLKIFDCCGDAAVVGEASVRYLYSTVAAGEIRKFNPAAKIIIFVRDQDQFVPSWHNQMLYRAQDWVKDFEQAWRLSGNRDETSVYRTREPMFLDYKWLGKFSPHVERYFEHFPPQQIRVFHFRDWSRDPRRTYVEILSFLEVPDDGRMSFPKINEAKHLRARWLGSVLVNPPRGLQPAARLARRLFGKSFDRLIRLLLNVNRKEGYLTQTSAELRAELRQYYAEDNALLESRIWKPRRSTRTDGASSAATRTDV